MPESQIPSGRGARDSQADGSAPGGSAAPEPGQPGPAAGEHRFEVGAVWSGNARGSGTVRVADGTSEVAIAGALELGGSGGAANPEELLLAALAACFVNTWAIFIEKLKIAYADPAIRVSGTLGKDPAGGFRMTGTVIHARVPGALLASDREKIEKSLALSEKYCIISRVARAAMPVAVEIETI